MGDGTHKKFLSPEQESLVRRMLAGGASITETAAAAGITVRRLRTRQEDQLADVRVGRGRGGGPRRWRDPTPEEIAAATAQIRRGWPPERWGLHEPDSMTDATRHGREIRLR
jgi:hypothetical protein